MRLERTDLGDHDWLPPMIVWRKKSILHYEQWHRRQKSPTIKPTQHSTTRSDIKFFILNLCLIWRFCLLSRKSTVLNYAETVRWQPYLYLKRTTRALATDVSQKVTWYNYQIRNFIKFASCHKTVNSIQQQQKPNWALWGKIDANRSKMRTQLSSIHDAWPVIAPTACVHKSYMPVAMNQRTNVHSFMYSTTKEWLNYQKKWVASQLNTLNYCHLAENICCICFFVGVRERPHFLLDCVVSAKNPLTEWEFELEKYNR